MKADFDKMFENAFENGNMSIGLSAGIDPDLQSDERLVLFPNVVDAEESLSYTLGRIKVSPNLEVMKILYSGALAVVAYDCYSDNECDVVKSYAVSNKDVKVPTAEYRQYMQKTMTLICATKINFFTTNHHTGMVSLGAYPQKIFKALFNPFNEIEVNDEIVKAIHTIAHWGSTTRILKTLGITGIKGEVSKKLEFANDFVIRRSAMPAGTGSLALCRAILNKLVRSKVIYAIQYPTLLKDVYTKYKEIEANKGAYHISAFILTGKQRLPFSDAEYTGLLGLLGSFIMHFFPGSSICRSPKIKTAKDTIYKLHELYDESFDSLCRTVKFESTKALTADVSEYMPDLVSASPEGIRAIDELIEQIRRDGATKEREILEEVTETIDDNASGSSDDDNAAGAVIVNEPQAGNSVNNTVYQPFQRNISKPPTTPVSAANYKKNKKKGNNQLHYIDNTRGQYLSESKNEVAISERAKMEAEIKRRFEEEKKKRNGNGQGR